MAKPRNWLAVHAHFRSGSGPHTGEIKSGPSAAEWGDDWRAELIGSVATAPVGVIPSVHVRARDPNTKPQS